MQRLSATSTIKSAAAFGTGNTALTQRPGSTASGGMTTANPDATRAWLVSQRPDTVDAKIRASLTSQLGVVVNVNREWRFPEGRAPYQVATTAGLKELSTENCSAALAKVEAAFTPLDRDHAERMVAQLHAVLARRNGSGETAEIAFDVYVHVLLKHPADIAKAVVETLCTEPRKDGGTAWFPTPPEVEAMCRDLSSDRIALRTALRSWKPIDPAQAEVERLEAVYRRLRSEASALETKIGPGPASDTGARGERIEAARLKAEEAAAAKKAWLEAQKTVLDDALNT